MDNYVPLHCHTFYSELDSSASPEAYLARAKELGMTHMSITDHGTPAGHRHFQRAAKAAGIIPILGVEAYHTEDMHDRRSSAKRTDGTQVYNHLTILAKNEEGLQNLNYLNKMAWQEGFYYKPRIGKDLLLENSSGLIVLSGCMSGMLSKAFMNNDPERAYRIAAEHKEALGDDYYIEVMATNDMIDDAKGLNGQLLKLADDLGIKPVMTSDCHYVSQEDLPLEEAILILSTVPKPNFNADMSKAKKMDLLERFNYLYPDRQMTFEKIEVFLRSYESERSLFERHGITRQDIFESTHEIAAKVGDYPYHENLSMLPKVKEKPKSALRTLCEKAMEEMGLHNDQRYIDRLYEELKVIFDKDFEVYFIILNMIMNFARENDIRTGFGRGSGAGSLVNYLLGMTQVDPIKYNLLFMRFLDPSRSDPPDVDIDFEDTRREEVKDFIRQTFPSVAGISTISYFQGKSSIRDAARVLRVPVAEVNQALKDNDASLLMNESEKYYDWFIATPRGKKFNRKHPEVVELARLLHGKLKQFGQHPSAIVASQEPIENYAPIQTAKRSGSDTRREDIIALDMGEVEGMGFNKLDILGLKSLSVVGDTLKYIKERHGVDVDLFNLDLEDEDVYNEISKGHTKGIFQCLPKDSVITTADGAKMVQDINVGDRVFTHTGNIKPVVRVMSRIETDEIYDIHLARTDSRPISLTGEHPVLISDESGNTEWVKASEIVAGRKDHRRIGHRGIRGWNSYAVMPKTSLGLLPEVDVNNEVPELTETANGFSVIRKNGVFHGEVAFDKRFVIDNDTARILGLFTAEGFTSKSRFGFSFSKHEDEYIEFVEDYFFGRYGIRGARRVTGSNGGGINVVFSHVVLSRLLASLCGSGAKNKAIPEVIFSASEDIQKSFLRGLADGDGSYNSRFSKAVRLQTASYGLAHGVNLLLANFGRYSQVGHHQRETRNGTICDVYTVQWADVDNDDGYVRSINSERYTLVPIRSVERRAFTGEVYNFEVRDDNSYISQIVMHNCEQPAYTGLILEMGGVNNFDELVASNALVRPGANKTIGKDYVARKSGKEPVVYMHEKIRYFTEDTYGLPTLFQEQQMLACVELGGMTMGEANVVRRGLGKKEIEKIHPFKEKFIENASELIGQGKAEKLWADLEYGAEYNFNKSHSVAYSMLSYATAWLKHHYPVEFMAAVIRNEENKDSVTDYLIEARRLGIKIKLPHVNRSGLLAEPEGEESIRLGLRNIKYCGDKVARAVLLHRPFKNYAELEAKVAERGSGMNKRMLSTMNLVGAATFPDNPKNGREREHYYDVLSIPAFANSHLDPRVEHQIVDVADLIPDEPSIIKVMLRGIVKKDGWARADVLDESGSGGFFTNPDSSAETGKMYLMLVSGNSIVRAVNLENVNSESKNSFVKYIYGTAPELSEGQYFTIAFKPRKTKAGKDMANLVAMDHMGKLFDILVWPSDFESAKQGCGNGRVWKNEVKAKEDDEGVERYFLSMNDGRFRFGGNSGRSN